MSLRFLADADLNAKIYTGLQRKEPAIDFLSARTGGVLGLKDPQVLLLAAQAGRVLVSHDLKTMPGHFSRFVRNNESPGLILLPQELEIGLAIEDLLLTWATADASDLANTILYLPF